MKLFLCVSFAFLPCFNAVIETVEANVRRGGPNNEFDEAGNCISDLCQAAYLAFVESAEASQNATIATNTSNNDSSRLLSPINAASFFEDPSSLFEGCLDEDIQVQAVASSSGNWGRPTEAWLPSIASNGRLQCNELFCFDDDAWFSWVPCPRDPSGTSSGGNYHYLDAGPGVSTGAWFELEWPEPQCLCQIWIDTKGYMERYPCGRDGMQNAPNRVLNADIQYWDEEAAEWNTVGSKMDATDDWGFVFPECVSSSKLRLFNVGTGLDTGFQARNPILYELKVYNCESECQAAGRPALFMEEILENSAGEECTCWCPQ